MRAGRLGSLLSAGVPSRGIKLHDPPSALGCSVPPCLSRSWAGLGLLKRQPLFPLHSLKPASLPAPTRSSCPFPRWFGDSQPPLSCFRSSTKGAGRGSAGLSASVPVPPGERLPLLGSSSWAFTRAEGCSSPRGAAPGPKGASSPRAQPAGCPTRVGAKAWLERPLQQRRGARASGHVCQAAPHGAGRPGHGTSAPVLSSPPLWLGTAPPWLAHAGGGLAPGHYPGVPRGWLGLPVRCHTGRELPAGAVPGPRPAEPVQAGSGARSPQTHPPRPFCAHLAPPGSLSRTQPRSARPGKGSGEPAAPPQRWL